jgi:hypothetical protein
MRRQVLHYVAALHGGQINTFERPIQSIALGGHDA